MFDGYCIPDVSLSQNGISNKNIHIFSDPKSINMIQIFIYDHIDLMQKTTGVS